MRRRLKSPLFPLFQVHVGRWILNTLQILCFSETIHHLYICRWNWIVVWGTAETSMLSQIYLSELEKYGEKLFFECNFSEKAVDRIQLNNIFCKEILKAWCSENWKNPICSYGNEILWNNTHIKADVIHYFTRIGAVKDSCILKIL